MQDAELAHRLRVLAEEATSHDGTSGPLARLGLLRKLRRVLVLAEGEATFDARLTDHEWTEIGEALGMSAQGAGQRYRRHGWSDPRPVENQRRRPR